MSTLDDPKTARVVAETEQRVYRYHVDELCAENARLLDQLSKLVGRTTQPPPIHVQLPPNNPDFVECAACKVKPGSPILCASCLSNRGLIGKLRDEIAGLRTECARLRGAVHAMR